MSLLIPPIASLIVSLSTTLVHPTLFPFPWATTIHATRMTIGFRNRVRLMGYAGKLPPAASCAGFLITCWMGGALANLLMFRPPPQLLSSAIWVNYLSIHFLLNYVLDSTGLIIPPILIDSVLPLLDAIGRTGGLCANVSLASAHPNPAIANSLFFQLIIGAISSAGGSSTAATLGVWSPQWSLTTPPFLVRTGHVETLDIWSGALIAAIYGCLMGLHPSYAPYARYLSGKGDAYVAGTALMTAMEARSTCVVVLASLYVYRVYRVHWQAKSAPRAAPPASSTKEKLA